MTNREKILTAVALIFHVAGAIGMSTPAREWFINCTPYTLTLMTALVIFSLTDWNNNLKIFMLFSAAVGFAAEWIGVNTGFLFGEYTYGHHFGIKAGNVPLLIGALWFTTVYSGIQIVRWWEEKTGREYKSGVTALSAAALITGYDVILEPAAIKLGYWSWEGGTVPLFNYFSWFIVSAFIIFISELFFKTKKNSSFPVILCLIQIGFYIWHLVV